MYDKVLDERQVARDIIDAIRSNTDAPLHTCIDAAKACIAVMAPFISIQEAVIGYAVCVNDCYDFRLLSQIKEQLARLFKEKDELSFSSEQNDTILIRYLQAFSDCVAKTDPGVVGESVTSDDFDWLNRLITVYQMDQNDEVRFQGLSCIMSLVNACSSLNPFLLNSRLPEILALQFQNHDVFMTGLHLTAIKLLAKIYSSDKEPPLTHFDFYDSSFFMKLLLHLREHPREILDFIVNFSFLIPPGYDNPVIVALESNPYPFLGQLLVKVMNEELSIRRLRFFLEIAGRSELYKELFYANDLNVLSHVLARELINSESKEIRTHSMTCIARLAKLGYCDHMVWEAVENSDLNYGLRKAALDVIMKNHRDR